ncbi:hypothetical protein D9758_013951 [Tetrapyrgos nigripes]|uniref:Uncharacterized protein n=1 Tax=Tetrapyrgos nigripes TaxID=182062 RepID=A0A8H5CGX2_9AGAR|nr:hypothetical protein D9758_013951 [Tetrapyrgos nigripes]
MDQNKVAFDRERMVRNQKTASMVAFVSFDRGRNTAPVNSRLQPVRPPSPPEIPPPMSRISKPFRIKPREQSSTTHLAPTQHIYQRNHAFNPTMQLINVHSSPSTSSPTASLRYSSYMGLQPHRMILTPLTDRQLDVQSLIHQLQARMIRLEANANDPNDDKNTVEEIEEEVTITRLKADVEKLRNVRESEWARGVSDEVPKEWEELRNSSTAAVRIQSYNNTFSWIRDSNDPADFFLQKIKIDGDDGPTTPSPPVAVPNIAAAGGQGLMHFNRAGNPKKAFFNMLVTVQDPNSVSGVPQGNNSSDSDDDGQNGSNRHNGNGNHNHGGDNDDNNQMMTPGNGKPSSTQQDIPKIVGIVLGVVAFMFLIAALLIYRRYRRRRQTNNFQRNMMFRSPGSVKPFLISQPMDPEKQNDFSSPSSFSQPGTYAAGLAYQRAPSTISDSIGTSVSQRRPNEVKGPRNRDSGTTATSSNQSDDTGDNEGSLVQFPVPSFPARIRTSRQIMVEEDIQTLQRKMLELQARRDLTGVDAIDREEQMKEVKERVERLKKVHEGPWALRQTEAIPAELFN